MQVYFSPPKIITGAGSATALGDEAVALGGKSVVIVTDKVLRQKTDCVTDALASLKRAGLEAEIFDDVEPDPMVSTAERCAEFAASVGPNLIVGLGGGSSMDVAKAASAVLGNEVPLDQMWGMGNVPMRGLPMILLPTTSGTGSEVTPNSIMTGVNPDGSHMKRGIVSPLIIANTAIVDP